MVIVTIYGSLAEMSEEAKQSLYRDCAERICDESEFDLNKSDLVFNFPSGSTVCTNKPKKVISATVDGFSVESEAIARIRRLFAVTLGMRLEKWFPDAIIHVRVRLTNPEEATWISGRKTDIRGAVRQLDGLLGPNAGVGDECLDHRRY